MNTLLTVFIFVTILFLYIHIVEQYKKSEDLEIYEMDYINNTQFQEVCDIKQPVLFEFKQFEPEIFQEMNIQTISTRAKDDIKLIDTNDYWKTVDTVDYITAPFQTVHKVIETDTNAHFFTEHNEVFMDENGFSKKLEQFNTYFKPVGTVQTHYDFMFGSKQSYTPLRYHTDFRHLLCVSSGKIHIKMTPWKSSKYLEPIKDYEKYEFKSPINVWNPQQKYMHEMDKIRFLEFEVFAGYVFYIPPYWWYSIKYSDEDNTSVFACTYNTIMNRIANIPDIGMYLLQQQNITKKITKTLSSENIPLSPPEIPSSNKNIQKESNTNDQQSTTTATATTATATNISTTSILSLPLPSETTEIVSQSVELPLSNSSNHITQSIL